MPRSLGRPSNPTRATPARLARAWFGLAPFRSPLLRCHLTSSGYVRCFSSPAYLHTGYVFTGGSSRSSREGVSPFGDPRLPACTRLPEAFRCFATSFIGIPDRGIHRTPCFTVLPARGRPRRAPAVSICCCLTLGHVSHQPAANFLALLTCQRARAAFPCRGDEPYHRRHGVSRPRRHVCETSPYAESDRNR